MYRWNCHSFSGNFPPNRAVFSIKCVAHFYWEKNRGFLRRIYALKLIFCSCLCVNMPNEFFETNCHCWETWKVTISRSMDQSVPSHGHLIFLSLSDMMNFWILRNNIPRIASYLWNIVKLWLINTHLETFLSAASISKLCDSSDFRQNNSRVLSQKLQLDFLFVPENVCR